MTTKTKTKQKKAPTKTTGKAKKVEPMETGCPFPRAHIRELIKKESKKS